MRTHIDESTSWVICTAGDASCHQAAVRLEPLASPFVEAARPIPQLQTLRETRDRFRLNAQLAIPFDAWISVLLNVFWFRRIQVSEGVARVFQELHLSQVRA